MIDEFSPSFILIVGSWSHKVSSKDAGCLLLPADADTSVVEPPTTEPANLQDALAGIGRDYSSLSPRLRQLNHSVVSECAGVTLRVHFPTIVQGKATVHELLDAIIHFLPWFALPRSELAEVKAKFEHLSPDDVLVESSKLFEAARDLFIKANKATKRNGEAGEFILAILTEWILNAPQVIAKMSLKTNPAMHIHGADGVHGRFSSSDNRLILFWGESKLYADVGQAMTEAAKSILEANSSEKQKHELQLVSRYIDFSGLDQPAKKEFMKFLDPFDESSNNKKNVTTCLIGFNCSLYAAVAGEDANAEAKFRELITDELASLSTQLASKLKSSNLEHQVIEMFFLPVPSVEELRIAFQKKIGWQQ